MEQKSITVKETIEQMQLALRDLSEWIDKPIPQEEQLTRTYTLLNSLVFLKATSNRILDMMTDGKPQLKELVAAIEKTLQNGE